MTNLFIFIVVGIALLMAFLLLGLQGPAKVDKDASALTAVAQIVTLQGTSFVNGDRLLDDAEYRLLKSNPDLHPVAAKLWRERRELALLWIDALHRDLRILWRFRQFVIQRGAPTHLSEEWAILRSLIAAVIFLRLLRLSVLTLGPFALTGMTRRARHPVDSMSRAAASVLGRVPSAGWSDLERAWAATAI